MSERYYITGVQIGILKVMVEWIIKESEELPVVKRAREIQKIIEEFIENQFVGNITQEGERVAIIG